jgi:hypothetical protein
MSGILKTLLALSVLAALGAGVWLAAPLFYDTKVNEAVPESSSLAPAAPEQGALPQNLPGAPLGEGTLPVADQGTPVEGPEILATGSFQGADQFHQASGTAHLIEVDGKTYVRFEDDFSVTNGPDLFVYFGNNGTYDEDTNLGRLKGSKGSQNYEVPVEIDPSQYSEVWVWCRAFAVPFGSAELSG